MKRAFVAIAAFYIFAVPCLAGQPDVKKIPDGTNWVAHLDVKGFTETKLYKTFISPLAKFQACLPPAPPAATDNDNDEDNETDVTTAPTPSKLITQLEQLDSITVFAPKDQENLPTMLITGKYNQSAVRKISKIADDAKPQEYNNHAIYTINRCKKEGSQQPYLCFYNETTIVSGINLELLKKELDVLDGKGQAISEKSDLATQLTSSTNDVKPFIMMAVSDPASLAKTAAKNKRPLPPCFSKFQRLGMNLADIDGKLSLSAIAVANEPADAARMEKVITGMIAMLELASDDNNLFATISKSVKFESATTASTVKFSATASIEDIMKIASLAHRHAMMMNMGCRKGPAGKAKSCPTSKPAEEAK